MIWLAPEVLGGGRVSQNCIHISSILYPLVRVRVGGVRILARMGAKRGGRESLGGAGVCHSTVVV